MDEKNFALTELYDISINAIVPVTIGERSFEAGESILFFDSLQLTSLFEIKDRRAARGGRYNIDYVVWERTTGAEFICEHGVVSERFLSILSNSKIATYAEDTVTVPKREVLESDEDGVITLSQTPITNGFFIYDGEYNKLASSAYSLTDDVISGLKAFTYYTISYNFIHTSTAKALMVGQRLFNGYYSVTAKMRLKDDTAGTPTTAIVEIPRVRIVSDLSMRLGSYVSSNVSTFRISGEPVGQRGMEYVCRIIFLDSDIDAESPLT